MAEDSWVFDRVGVDKACDYFEHRRIPSDDGDAPAGAPAWFAFRQIL
jgi:hypothetical protein